MKPSLKSDGFSFWYQENPAKFLQGFVFAGVCQCSDNASGVLFLSIAEGSRTHNGLKCHFCPSLRYLHREIRPVCPCASALIWTKIAILNFCEPKGTDFVIENGSRSEGIPGVFQATRVVLCAKAVLLGVMGSIPFGYSTLWCLWWYRRLYRRLCSQFCGICTWGRFRAICYICRWF